MRSSGCSDIGGKRSWSCAELSTDAVKYVMLLRTEPSPEVACGGNGQAGT